MGGQGTKWHRNIAENFNRLSRVHKCYRQQTTDRRHTDEWTMTYKTAKDICGLEQQQQQQQQHTFSNVHVHMCMHCQPQLLVKCRQWRRLQYKRPALQYNAHTHSAYIWLQHFSIFLPILFTIKTHWALTVTVKIILTKVMPINNSGWDHSTWLVIFLQLYNNSTV